MTHSFQRRALLAAGALAPFIAAAQASATAQASAFHDAMRRIEAATAGRLGVAVLDTQSGAAHAYRGDEAFAMCSTFKCLLAAQVLARVDRGEEQLTRPIAVQAADLVPYAPVTQPRVGGAPLTVAELCDAAVTLSDNVAANLLLKASGGPPALTAWLRTLGDGASRLDRFEPELNTAEPGDPRDTTTPRAMLGTLQKIVLGDALSPPSRMLLTQWLVGNRTGDKKLRAGLPAGWRAGDKTGAGSRGSNHDVAVLWPSGRAPVLVTAYLTETSADQAGRDKALADVARQVVSMVG
jgi:beta-lactamase class A